MTKFKLLGFFALSIVWVWPAAADYQTSYGRGLEALERKQWSEAASHFRQAIEEQPKAGGKISAAGKRQTYVPYFQLGLALYRAGEYREASEAWRVSAVQGALTRKMREVVEEYRWDIETRLAEQEAAALEQLRTIESQQPQLSGTELETRQRAAETQLERANQQVAALEAPDLQVAFATDAALVRRRDQGIEKLRQAKEIYEKTSHDGNPIALQEVHERAVDAATLLEDVRFAATLLALQQNPQAEPKEVATDLSTVEPPDSPTAGDPLSLPEVTEPPLAAESAAMVAVEPPTSEPKLTAVEPAMVEPAAVTPQPAPANVTTQSVVETVDETKPLAVSGNRPPAFLHDAATAFFSARYEDALKMLEYDEFENDRVRKHALLFRAASLYALYLLEDRQDTSRLSLAKTSIEACRSIDPRLRPTIEAFSPSFVSFFESIAAD